MVPLHLIAFYLLYVLTARLLREEIITATTDLARTQLNHESQEMHEVALAHTGDRPGGHLFDDLLAAHQDINFQLFLPGGRRIGGEPQFPPPVHRRMLEFLEGGAVQQIWLSEEGDQKVMRGLMRIVAAKDCAPCHHPGVDLAVASMSINLTPLMDRAEFSSRRNLIFLIGLWAMLLGATTVIVKRSIQRSAARLEADLAAAEAGERQASDAGPSFVMDPVSARLHESLYEFVERQRERQEAMASRLAHTDQLASLGQLAAGLAHEIKNPLAGIQGALEILREDVKDKNTEQLYVEMLNELKRVNGTLQTLLTSARPSPPRLATTDVRELLTDVRRLMEPGLRRKEITLKAEIAPGRLGALMDAAKIRQVLINLIHNAAEAIGTKGTITLRAGSFPEGGGIILAVEDNGPGIPVEHQAKILEPFYTTKFSGTGLGLAIARSLVEQHGGSLQFESESGVGTTFYLLFTDDRHEQLVPDPDTAEDMQAGEE